MIRSARILSCLLCLLLAHAPLSAAPDQESASSQSPATTLGDLLESVRDGSARRREALAERERRFIEARDERGALLDDVRSRRQQAEAEADRLRRAFDAGEDELADLETTLDERAGDLTEVFAVVHQVSTDVAPIVQNSMVSAQIPGRSVLLERLADSEAIPSAEDLRGLWLMLLEEMSESGRVERFEAPVITESGEEAMREVTRIGTFTAISEGAYLRFLPETGRLLALARQPAGVTSASLRAFEAAEAPLASVALDPSRGAILALIIQTPELRERIDQGGIIGYLILALGAVGLLLGIERSVVVAIAGRRDRIAFEGDATDDVTSIGQLRRLSRDPDYLADAEAMSAKMDEIVTIASQHLNRGLPTLAIFAAVSPLLGLLGTVTGMIETFQVITLFGAGDPRLMSGGISQALITTQLGLAVAIPLLLIHSFVQGRANILTTRLDEAAADLFARSRAENVSHGP